MNDVTTFLLARIAEDESVALAASTDAYGSEQWSCEPWLCDEQGSHVAVDPPRMLAECEAKRRIVSDALDFAEQYRVERTPTREGMRWAAMVAVGQLATIYADHPDYREEWKP